MEIFLADNYVYLLYEKMNSISLLFIFIFIIIIIIIIIRMYKCVLSLKY
jgi:hypothetical protein